MGVIGPIPCMTERTSAVSGTAGFHAKKFAKPDQTMPGPAFGGDFVNAVFKGKAGWRLASV